jgi:hypothetical protein
MSIIEKYNMHENKENFLQSSGSKASRETNPLTISEDRITLTESWTWTRSMDRFHSAQNCKQGRIYFINLINHDVPKNKRIS